jgi:hypothetical protein
LKSSQFIAGHQFPFAVSASPKVQGPQSPVHGTIGDAPQFSHSPFQSGFVSGLDVIMYLKSVPLAFIFSVFLATRFCLVLIAVHSVSRAASRFMV